MHDCIEQHMLMFQPANISALPLSVAIARSSFGQIRFNVFTGCLLDMFNASRIPMASLKVQEALEEELHLLGRQLHVCGALE